MNSRYNIPRLSGNITILALFVLLASSLMGILVALYMKNFLKYSEEISSYERATYLAKAGYELGLAIVGNREVGLTYSFDEDNAKYEEFMSQNFECPFPKADEECPNQPVFSVGINGLDDSYNGCSPSEPTTIKAGLSAIIPLFQDPGISDIQNCLTSVAPSTKKYNLNIKTEGGIWKYSTISMNSRGNLDLGEITLINGAKNENFSELVTGDHPYLIVANTTTNNQNLCISSADSNPFPQETVKITSVGKFNGRTVGIETSIKKGLPDFLQGDNYLN